MKARADLREYNWAGVLTIGRGWFRVEGRWLVCDAGVFCYGWRQRWVGFERMDGYFEQDGGDRRSIAPGSFIFKEFV